MTDDLITEGRAKVLDFGLAKALAGDGGPGDPASSPTLTMRATVAGTLMRTAAYMSSAHRLALCGTGQIRPRVINVDGHPAYARASEQDGQENKKISITAGMGPTGLGGSR